MASKDTTKTKGRRATKRAARLAESQTTLLALAKSVGARKAVEIFARGLCGHLLLADVLHGVERGMIGAAIDSTEHGTLAEVADKLGQDEAYFADHVSKLHHDYWLRMKRNASPVV